MKDIKVGDTVYYNGSFYPALFHKPLIIIDKTEEGDYKVKVINSLMYNICVREFQILTTAEMLVIELDKELL